MYRVRQYLVIALAVLFAAFLTSCGGSGSDPYGESRAQSIEGKAVTIEMMGNQFAPQGVKVAIGTTVTWTNKDQVVHNVRQIEDAFLSPDSVAPGETFSYTFQTAGTFRYQCTYHHPTMNGVVIVEQR